MITAHRTATIRPVPMPAPVHTAAPSHRCTWHEGPITPHFSALDRCPNAARLMVEIDGVPVGPVCQLHADRALAKFWKFSPLSQ
jgi:hypothetical protein